MSSLFLGEKKTHKKQETPLHNTAIPSDSNAECVTETPVVITRKTGPWQCPLLTETADKIYVNT